MAAANQTGWDIESLAEQAARELLAAVPTLKSDPPIERNIAIALALQAEQGSFSTLVNVFSRDASFGDLRNGWIQQRGGSGSRVEVHAVPRLLISSVIDGRCVKSILEEARAFAASRTSTTESYTPLAGVTVKEVTSLGDDIDLVPWAEVPESTHKMSFYPSLSTPIAMSAFPNSAIRTRSVDSQVLFSSCEDAEAAFQASKREGTTRIVQIQDVLRCITATIACPVADLGSWIQCGKKIANEVSIYGCSCTGVSFDFPLYGASFDPVMLDDESINRLHQSFRKIKSSEKNVMRVALDRLNQALRRRSDVDKAIDLGIALEVMLLHGIGKDDRGELRFRSSIRGATFLGSEKQERLKAFKLLKAAYDLRSQAVHCGVLKEGKKAQSPNQILEKAASTCAQIAKKLIERGSFPDWDTDCVIGDL